MYALKIPTRFYFPNFLTNKQAFVSGTLSFILLSSFCLYLFLGYGFMQISIGILPIGEVLLFLSFLLINHRVLLPKFLHGSHAIPLLVWWVFGISHIIWNLPQYGIMAIRDGSHVIESLYVYIGFAFAGSFMALKRLSKWLSILSFAVLVYAMAFPFRDVLQPYSPTLTGAYMQPVPLAFTYTNTALVMMAGAVYFIYAHSISKKSKDLFWGIAALSLSLILFPSRTLLLEIGAFVVLIFPLLRKTGYKSFLTIILLPLLLLTLISFSGIEINGRLGEEFRIQDYFQLASEIFGNSKSEKGLSSGTELRYEWWLMIFEKLKISAKNFIFGLGYGMPLVDFVHSGGSQIREPHNDFLGILARGGITSLVSFVFFQVIFILKSLKVREKFGLNSEMTPALAFLFATIAFTLINTIGESPFVMTFYTMPYYFSAGILLRLYKMRGHGLD
jgi:hypothetical protein